MTAPGGPPDGAGDRGTQVARQRHGDQDIVFTSKHDDLGPTGGLQGRQVPELLSRIKHHNGIQLGEIAMQADTAGGDVVDGLQILVERLDLGLARRIAPEAGAEAPQQGVAQDGGDRHACGDVAPQLEQARAERAGERVRARERDAQDGDGRGQAA